jgi:hypothetical protein
MWQYQDRVRERKREKERERERDGQILLQAVEKLSHIIDNEASLDGQETKKVEVEDMAENPNLRVLR